MRTVSVNFPKIRSCDTKENYLEVHKNTYFYIFVQYTQYNLMVLFFVNVIITADREAGCDVCSVILI